MAQPPADAAAKPAEVDKHPGFYDAATPYFAAEYTFNHMGLTMDNHKNVSRGQYNAGHMVYIDNQSMDTLHRDVDALFDRAEGK